MTRRTKAELESAYAEKLALFEVLWNWQKQFLTLPTSDDIDPLIVAKRNRKKFTTSQALSGLKQAINDILESAGNATVAEIVNLNARLKVAGQPPFLELSNQSSKKVQSALNDGKIKSSEQYYLITALLNDVDHNLLAEKVAAFNALLSAYETLASQ